MAALSVSTVRTRIAAGVTAIGGWRESRWAFGLFGRDTEHVVAQSFAVGVEETQMHPSPGRRVVRSEGALVVTTVTVTWASRLRADAQVADYGAALDAEAALIVGVLAVSLADLHLEYLDSRRSTSTEGYLMGTVRFAAMHHLALQ